MLIPDPDIQTVRAIIFGWMVLPVLPLVHMWRRGGREASGRRGPRIVLALVTVSQAWLLSMLIHPETIGPSYSEVRWAVVFANLGGMLATAVSAVVLRGPLWGLLTLTSLWLVTSWFYVLVVSSAI